MALSAPGLFANSAHSHTLGSRTAQECDHDSGGTYSHRCYQNPLLASLFAARYLHDRELKINQLTFSLTAILSLLDYLRNQLKFLAESA